MHFAILGAGSWGTAIALQLVNAGHRATLVARRYEHALEMGAQRENADYLPGFTLPTDLQLACEVAPSVMEAEVVFLACPVKGLAAALQQLAAARPSAWRLQLVLTLCKGLDPESLRRPGELVAEALPGLAHGTLSGPSAAEEVAGGKPCAVVLAVEGGEPVRSLVDQVQEILSEGRMRVYRSEDLTGVELGGALKNPYAIGAGICDGLDVGDSAKASYLTRVMAEMQRVGTALGGKAETFTGLAGIGDLIATAHGGWSRNRGFGEALARGKHVDELLSDRRSVVEGYPAIKAFHERCARLGVDAPILEQLYAICYEGRPAPTALDFLMKRPLKGEH
ncbi:MAG: NAD(P)H-dependent glycerol-3-phosphate dehydrogenase [Opitutales bacterium]